MSTARRSRSASRPAPGLLDDKDLYEQGHALAKAGHYEAALAALTAIEDQDDSMVLTMIGYSLRKSGKWDDGVAYYHRALAIDPNNVNTHEYLGEAFLAKGRIDLAQEQLATDRDDRRDRVRAVPGAGLCHRRGLDLVSNRTRKRRR